MINCKVSLILTCSESFALTSKATGDDITAQGGNPAVVDNPRGTTFKITDTKLCVPAFTLTTNNDHKFLEQLNTGFKGTGFKLKESNIGQKWINKLKLPI